jgi:hypothetical protein
MRIRMAHEARKVITFRAGTILRRMFVDAAYAKTAHAMRSVNGSGAIAPIGVAISKACVPSRSGERPGTQGAGALPLPTP